MSANEPIVAVATGSQKAPVAITRISGEDLSQFLGLFSPIEPRVAKYYQLTDNDGTVLDNGVVIYFKAPHSLTGEDVIEFQGHGGPFIVEGVQRFFRKLGARPARPGEFSERAFLNGKMDLAQAEAIVDVIDAQSMAAAQAAIRSMNGRFSQEITRIEHDLRTLRALVEGAIDFSDEEIEFIETSALKERLELGQQHLKTLLVDAQQGRLLRDGIKIALIGAPNVGKSTLFNTLVEDDRAITSDIAGTTRDVINADFEINGVPITLLDTAGLRESDDPIEQLGIERSRKMAAEADVIILMSADNEPTEYEANHSTPVIKVMNKVDISANTLDDHIAISAKSGLGLDSLKDALLAVFNIQEVSTQQFTARQRHISAIEKAQDHITLALKNLAGERGIELIAEEIRLAHDALGMITGTTHSDDILGDIFSTFCIGK